ncbi:uncharacterized protein UMAG_10590 [Mycosarcoma maydis]|uniref:Uncharacterized protein n=1 Tax=Mycosarcoma maydis TaxID=5270 RepID=A0A0D1E621_MYCMD|nr:uncharacterized protein UMAG_10590 [Ustilago maydis 521]KIS71046.1 hypothetical protein UMAG_10590 [Ustilago maydis 521]|eukprot:XP_011387341.1 hypothetical protein UMAG_10590 [Ustilago maydis 521]
MQRYFSTSVTRACWLGDQRVASRVPRLVSKDPSKASSLQPRTLSHHFAQPGLASSETCTSRRSISEAFGLLAGSTASSRTGLRRRNISTWSHPSRSFSSTSSNRDLKQDTKDKLVEEGKKFAKDKLDSKLNATETREQAKNLSSSVSKILFTLLAVAGVAYQFVGGKTHAEEACTSLKPAPKYTKHQVSLLCLVGPSLSGKSTQAKRLSNHFPELDAVVQPKSIDELSSIIASRATGKKRTSLILDDFPTTLEDAQRIEDEIVPIFCFSFYDLPLGDFEKRLSEKDEKKKREKVDEFNKYSERLEPLVKKYRHQGNIYEISADWNSADEVWEQVEAKTQQILELRERGDL